MFKKILIANRSEIACRIIRTARRLTSLTVAVYSTADAQALHVKMADEAYCLGPAPSSESYLRADAIIAIAKAAGAEAIHPGYGFLSENAEFAEQCAQAGICFIGPSPQAIRLMGGKNTAKQLMQAAGVPVTPGYHQENQETAILQNAAAEIGYPVLIKAVAGGGGKGMRVVTQAADFIDALTSARAEAQASFGDDRVLLEKYLTDSRHIEVQLFADTHGHVLYLFERDCSLQRRHQKILEEAPAPCMNPNLRRQMGEAAVKAARAIDYHGAGTIEFLLTPDQQFYFMEMNTRLQVEHPVTEMITGLDLVEWQLRVAAGELLPIQHQQQLSLHGHAIEARIYAEDPQKDFMPAVGDLTYLKMPDPTAHVRVDSGVTQGDTISIYYDPLIAKLIVWGEDRQTALSALSNALAQVQVIGVQTNVSLLATIIKQPAYIAAELSTHFIENNIKQLLAADNYPPQELIVLVTLAIAYQQKQQTKTRRHEVADLYSPWLLHDNWRLNMPAQQIVYLQIEDKKITAVMSGEAEINQVCFEEKNYEIKNFQVSDDDYSALINQKMTHARILFLQSAMHVFNAGHYYLFNLNPKNTPQKATDTSNKIVAPMPGSITELFVEVGQTVKKGDRLLVVEAMKMQHTLYAAKEGKVKEIFYGVGELIKEGVQLIAWEESANT